VVYQVKRKDMSKVRAEMMTAAIRNTLLALNLNVEIDDEYLKIAGEVCFTTNKDRQMTAWVNRAGLQAIDMVNDHIEGCALRGV
jgi:hypothetical protein